MSLPLPLVLATANPDKAREIVEILGEGLGERVASLPLSARGATYAYLVDRPAAIGRAASALPPIDRPPDVSETGATLEDNARIKARTLAGALDLPALADDTGLEVDALGGAPGVRSGRYAGEGASYADNVAKLLRELRGADRREARFVTVAIARFPDGRELVARGAVEGRVATEPRGDGTFGYDPVFEPAGGGGRTFAEMAPSEKHARSHRGRAFRALAEALSEH